MFQKLQQPSWHWISWKIITVHYRSKQLKVKCHSLFWLTGGCNWSCALFSKSGGSWCSQGAGWVGAAGTCCGHYYSTGEPWSVCVCVKLVFNSCNACYSHVMFICSLDEDLHTFAGAVSSDVAGPGWEEHQGGWRQSERDRAGGTAGFWTLSVPAAQLREQQGHRCHGNHAGDNHAAQTSK